jgi:hypothetical protein
MIFTKYSYIREDWHYPSSKIIALYERIGAYVLVIILFTFVSLLILVTDIHLVRWKVILASLLPLGTFHLGQSLVLTSVVYLIRHDEAFGEDTRYLRRKGGGFRRFKLLFISGFLRSLGSSFAKCKIVPLLIIIAFALAFDMRWW